MMSIIFTNAFWNKSQNIIYGKNTQKYRKQSPVDAPPPRVLEQRFEISAKSHYLGPLAGSPWD